MKINIIKGLLNKHTKISNTVFNLLKPIQTNKGKTVATIDASDIFGSNYKQVEVEVQDYRLL